MQNPVYGFNYIVRWDILDDYEINIKSVVSYLENLGARIFILKYIAHNWYPEEERHYYLPIKDGIKILGEQIEYIKVVFDLPNELYGG